MLSSARRGLTPALARVSSSRRASFAASHAASRVEVRGPAGAAADRVQLERVARDAKPGEQRVVELDDLGVDRRVVAADRLDGRLPVLAVAASTRRPVPVHRRDGEQLRGLWLSVHAVLDVGAADRRRPFRAQRQRPIRAIGERVHLLLHHVGAHARRADEERGVLEHRRLDRAVAVEVAEPLELAGDPAPDGHLGRDDVVRAARPLDLHPLTVAS